MEEENARQVSSPGGPGSDEISKSEEMSQSAMVCGNSSVSCVERDEKKSGGVGADVRVPISGGREMMETQTKQDHRNRVEGEGPRSSLPSRPRTREWSGSFKGCSYDHNSPPRPAHCWLMLSNISK